MKVPVILNSAVEQTMVSMEKCRLVFVSCLSVTEKWQPRRSTSY